MMHRKQSMQILCCFYALLSKAPVPSPPSLSASVPDKTAFLLLLMYKQLPPLEIDSANAAANPDMSTSLVSEVAVAIPRIIPKTFTRPSCPSSIIFL